MQGDDDATPPSWDERQQLFDQWLASDEKPAEDNVLDMLGMVA